MSRVHEANQEFIASVIVHESVHAYLDSKGFLYNTNKHQIMLADYVSVIARYLANNYGISEQDAFSLSFEGMEDIFANKLDSTTKQNIINELGNLLPYLHIMIELELERTIKWGTRVINVKLSSNEKIISSFSPDWHIFHRLRSAPSE